MKRSPNTRVSSPTILNLNAFSYHSAVLRGSDAFRWMWLIRNAMAGAFRRARGGVCARGSWPRDRVRGGQYICGLGPGSHVRILVMVAVPSGLRGRRGARLLLAGALGCFS